MPLQVLHIGSLHRSILSPVVVPSCHGENFPFAQTHRQHQRPQAIYSEKDGDAFCLCTLLTSSKVPGISLSRTRILTVRAYGRSVGSWLSFQVSQHPTLAS